MSNLTVLRSYAGKAHPEKLPDSVLFSHTETSITIFDAYPKSIFHFLILPRPTKELNIFDLTDLRSLLKKDRETVNSTLVMLKNEAAKLRISIYEEMRKRYGFQWGLWMGFHAVPSMMYVH